MVSDLVIGPPAPWLLVCGPALEPQYVRAGLIPPEAASYSQGVGDVHWRPIPDHWRPTEMERALGWLQEMLLSGKASRTAAFTSPTGRRYDDPGTDVLALVCAAESGEAGAMRETLALWQMYLEQRKGR